MKFLLNVQVILLHVTLHGHHISSIAQLNILGITPQGTISFNSESWSGCASDQRNTQNSNFLSKLTDGYTLLSVILTDGLRQRYSILEQTIPITFLGVSDNTTTLDKIVVVSCYLVNLCPSVVLFE